MIFDMIVQVFVEGWRVEFWGFGVFLVKYCEVCIGCNLRIGEFVQVDVKVVFYFKIGKEMCVWLNGGIEFNLKLDDLDEFDEFDD